MPTSTISFYDFNGPALPTNGHIIYPWRWGAYNSSGMRKLLYGDVIGSNPLTSADGDASHIVLRSNHYYYFPDLAGLEYVPQDSGYASASLVPTDRVVTARINLSNPIPRGAVITGMYGSYQILLEGTIGNYDIWNEYAFPGAPHIYFLNDDSSQYLGDVSANYDLHDHVDDVLDTPEDGWGYYTDPDDGIDWSVEDVTKYTWFTDTKFQGFFAELPKQGQTVVLSSVHNFALGFGDNVSIHNLRTKISQLSLTLEYEFLRVPPLRQRQRNDGFTDGSQRTYYRNGATSLQSSQRQGEKNTYL